MRPLLFRVHLCKSKAGQFSRNVLFCAFSAHVCHWETAASLFPFLPVVHTYHEDTHLLLGEQSREEFRYVQTHVCLPSLSSLFLSVCLSVSVSDRLSTHTKSSV